MNQDLHKCIAAMDKLKKNLDNLKINSLITKDKMNILCRVSPVSSATRAICPDITNNGCPHTKCEHPNFTCNHHSKYNYDTEFDYAYRTLFRIMVNDIHDGLFLHVIKLDGEKCDLKMSFKYDDSGIAEIIEVIKFLTA
jgi:hypothetical protein